MKRWRSVLVAAVTLALALLAWAVFAEPRRLVIVRREVGVPRWEGRPPLRLAVLSDLHVGAPHWGLARQSLLLDAVQRENVDAVVLLGDYVVHGVPGATFVPPEEFAPVLGRFRSRHGTFAVLGNHDGWLGAQRVTSALQQAGVHVLVNETALIGTADARVAIVGLDDLWTGAPDAAAALRGVDPALPAIALMHEPQLVTSLPAQVGLALAGHTHGGQVRLPFLGTPIVPGGSERWPRGLYREGAQQMLVTSGVGTSILPLRFSVPPEVVILTLRR